MSAEGGIYIEKIQAVTYNGVVPSNPIATESSRRQELEHRLIETSSWLTNSRFHSLQDELDFCKVGINACWSIFYEGGQLETERMLPIYRRPVMALVDELVEQRSLLQKDAADLASRACQLESMLDSQRGRFPSGLYWGEKAFKYASLADDSNLKVASLIRQIIIHCYLQQPQHVLEIGQRALLYIEKVSPLLQGKLYATMANAYAWLGQRQEALNYKGLALDTYPPNRYERDPSFAYTYFTYYSLHEEIGGMYLKLDNPKEALDEFNGIEQETPMIFIPRQAEIAYYQAEVGLVMGDLDRSYTRLEDAIKLALSCQQVHFDQSRAIYQEMQVKWPYEQKIKALAQFF